MGAGAGLPVEKVLDALGADAEFEDVNGHRLPSWGSL
jgi:hypothetical protein